jgi:hypothetical protein
MESSPCKECSYLTFPLVGIGSHFLIPSYGSEEPLSLQLNCTTVPVPHPTDFNSNDGGSMFLCETSQSTHKATQCHNLQKKSNVLNSRNMVILLP